MTPSRFGADRAINRRHYESNDRGYRPAGPALASRDRGDLDSGPAPPGLSLNRRSKIVCTLGPATSSAEAMANLVEAGMDIARLNFSHGTHQQHAQACLEVSWASDAVGRSVGILVDLQGPKIQLGTFAGAKPTCSAAASSPFRPTRARGPRNGPQPAIPPSRPTSWRATTSSSTTDW